MQWPTTLLVLTSCLSACTQNLPVYEIISETDDRVTIELARVDDRRVHFFTYLHQGEAVNFLVRSDGRGDLHCHLDACYSCYRYRRGYVVEGDALVCVACRFTFPLRDEVWDLIGACAPIEVHSKIEGHQLVIESSRLRRARRFF